MCDRVSVCANMKIHIKNASLSGRNGATKEERKRRGVTEKDRKEAVETVKESSKNKKCFLLSIKHWNTLIKEGKKTTKEVAESAKMHKEQLHNLIKQGRMEVNGHLWVKETYTGN